METKKQNSLKEFPEMVSLHQQMELNRVAKLMVQAYEKFVYPILFRFELLDDAHIRKYLRSSTAEDIYLDAMDKNREKWLYLERELLFNDTDLWASVRDYSSSSRNPREEGFVFVKLPYSDYIRKNTILKALTVKDCRISIDERILYEESVIKPTDEQRELYGFLAGFCEELEKKNIKKRALGELLCTIDEKICPNVRGILGVTLCSEKRNKR